VTEASVARSALTPHQERIALGALGGVPAPEPRATCANCRMCDAHPAPELVARFEPSLKCCTYHPLLRNFQLGAILGDPRAAEALEALLEASVLERVGG
jgi:hypothetical protein